MPLFFSESLRFTIRFFTLLILLNWMTFAYAISVTVNEDSSPVSIDLSGYFATVAWSVFHSSSGNSSKVTTSHSDWNDKVITLHFVPNANGSVQVSTWADGTLPSNVYIDVTIAPVSDPPVFTSTAPPSGDALVTYTYNITANDVDGDALTITALSLPAWLTLTDHGNKTATLSGIPSCQDTGTHNISLETSDGTFSATQNFSIDIRTCPPSNFTTTATATQPTVSQVVLNWTDNSQDETGFKVYRDGVEFTPSPLVAQDMSSYTDTGLTCATTYLYEIAATNALGDSAKVAQTLTTPPCSPSQFVVTDVTSGGAGFSWQDNSLDETGFKIERPTGNLIYTTIANATNYQDNGLNCDTYYGYALKATNTNGDSFPANTAVITKRCAIYASTPAPSSVIQFDAVVGQTTVQTLTIKELGDRALIFNKLLSTPQPPFNFPKPLPFTFIPDGGDPQTIELTCSPTERGTFSQDLQITTNDPDQPLISYILECIAKQSGFRSSIMDTGHLDFGQIPIAITRSFSIYENGDYELIVSNPNLSGAHANDFKIITPQFPLTIPDGAPAQIITVQCKPSGEGTRTANLQLTTNDPDYPTVSYELSCTATNLDIGSVTNVSTAKFNSSPFVNQLIDLGKTSVGQPIITNITVNEVGNAPLEVSLKNLFSQNTNEFSILSGLPLRIVDGGAAQTIQVQCIPSDVGTRVAVLQLATNDIYQAMASYTLVCSGEALPQTHHLTLNTIGEGTIDACGTQCEFDYPENSIQNLLTTPAVGWQFLNWTGDCTNSGQVEMTRDKTCTANFIQQTSTTPNEPIPPDTTTPSVPTTGTPTAPTSGLVTEATNNYGQTATNLSIETTGSVAGGTLAGTTINNGLVANVTIADNSTLTGGKLSGFNTNQGILQDITVSQYSQIQDGNYAGTITNNGTLLNPILLPNAQILNNGVLDNPVILPGSQVTGGKMTGLTIILGTLENVQLAPTAQVVTQVKDIPPVVFRQFNAQTLAQLPASMLSQITPAQFVEIPTKSLSGLTATNMGGLSPQVIQSMNKEQIAALQTEEFKQMPEDGVAKFLTNFDATAITPQEAEKLLPKDWKIDLKTGDLTAPPGSQFNLKAVKLPNTLPANLTLPSLPDLNSSFALSGKGTAPVLPQLNQILAKEGVLLEQQKTGILHAEVAGAAVTTKKKNRFAFMIDPNYLFILTEDALRGLKMNEQGQYILVTDDGKEIPITPMTKDPEGLLSILSKDATLDIRPTGEVLIKYIPNQRARDGEEVHSVGMFDPFIEPASDDVCQEDANGEMQCDWSKADESMQPGLRSARNIRAKAAAKIIYPDGSSQNLYPAVLFPDIFVAEAKKFAGVEKAIFRMDGTFVVTYQGTKLLLIPEFDTQVQPIPVGQKVEPSLTLQNGTLIYQVPYGDNLMTTQLSIIEAPVTQ